MLHRIILKSEEVSNGINEIQLCPVGEFVDAEGRKFKLTEENISAVITKSEKRKTRLVVDYEHQTLYGVQAPAAGWIKQLINKGKDGIWAVVEWTKKAQEYLANKEYRYLSPVLLAGKKDGDGNYLPEMLHSAALTNTPQIDGMIPIVNSNCGKCATSQNDLAEEVKMNKKMLELLGLKPEATEAEAVEALTVLKNKSALLGTETDNLKSELKKVRESLGLQETATVPEITGTILALKQPGNVVSVQEFNKLKNELATIKRNELVAMAMKSGKISSDQKAWAEDYAVKDPDGFAVFIAKAPVVVPMGNLPQGAKKEDGALDETTMLVAKMMGNKPEDVKKYAVNKE